MQHFIKLVTCISLRNVYQLKFKTEYVQDFSKLVPNNGKWVLEPTLIFFILVELLKFNTVNLPKYQNKLQNDFTSYTLAKNI